MDGDMRLENLLRECLDPDSLRVWMRQQFGREAADALPGPAASTLLLFHEAAKQISRDRGLTFDSMIALLAHVRAQHPALEAPLREFATQVGHDLPIDVPHSTIIRLGSVNHSPVVIAILVCVVCLVDSLRTYGPIALVSALLALATILACCGWYLLYVPTTRKVVLAFRIRRFGEWINALDQDRILRVAGRIHRVLYSQVRWRLVARVGLYSILSGVCVVLAFLFAVARYNGFGLALRTLLSMPLDAQNLLFVGIFSGSNLVTDVLAMALSTWSVAALTGRRSGALYVVLIADVLAFMALAPLPTVLTVWLDRIMFNDQFMDLSVGVPQLMVLGMTATSTLSSCLPLLVDLAAVTAIALSLPGEGGFYRIVGDLMLALSRDRHSGVGVLVAAMTIVAVSVYLGLRGLPFSTQ